MTKTRSVILSVLFAVVTILATALPAQAAGAIVSYRTGAPHGASVAVKSNGVWYALYPAQNRSSVTSIRIYAGYCMYWHYETSVTSHMNCNSSRTDPNYFVSVTSNMVITDVMKS